MSKTNEELLLAYKKANKERRKVILDKAGFVSEEKYISWLLNSEVDEKPTIHNVHIIDVSASMMGGKLQNAIVGINSEVDELKRDNTVNYTQTLVEFSGSNHIKTVLYKVPMSDVKPYNTSAYSSTALNQAVGETLSKLKNDAKDNEKVLVKIFTDGGENASNGPWKLNYVLSALIKECEEIGFTITFIGTKYDVDTVVRTLGVDMTNTYSHDNTSRGVQMAYMSMAGSTQSYAKKVLAKEDVSKGFFKTINKKNK